MKTLLTVLFCLSLPLIGADKISLTKEGTAPDFEISFNQKEPRGQHFEAGAQPIAKRLEDGVLDPTRGSISVWFQPRWTRESTRSRFGKPSSILQGYYPGPAIDRAFRGDEWHQLVTTWNANSVVRHYVDGELVARHTKHADTLPKEAHVWLGGATIWQITAAGTTPPKAALWPVAVNDFRLFKQTLSLDEIQTDYLVGAIRKGRFTPGQVAGNRVTDFRLGEKRILGSRNKPMFGFPSMGLDTHGHLYLKSKFGGEYNHGNRWKRSRDGGRTFEDVDAEASIAITKTLNAVPNKAGTRIAPDFHLVNAGSVSDKSALKLKEGVKQGWLRVVAKDGGVAPPEAIIAEPPFPTGQFNIASWMVSPQVVPALDENMLTLMFHIKKGVTHSATLWLMKSSDGGRTWKVLSEVSKRSPLFREGLNEATLMRGADGVLTCVARTGWSLVIIRSKDDGRTWLPWKFLGIDGVAPQAIELKSGMSLVTYGRPDVNLFVSLDENFQHWDAPFQIYNANRAPHEFVADWHQHGTFYVDSVEVEPGRLLSLYDTAGDSGAPGQRPQNRLWLQEAFIDSVAPYQDMRKERLTLDSDRLTFAGDWSRRSEIFATTRSDDAEIRFSFEGTGLVGQLTLIPDGGDLEIWIDGELRRVLKTAASHTHWLARRVLARDLKPGRHEARLVTRCPVSPRPLLPSAQELMRTSHIETIRDSRGRTRIVLHALEVIDEKTRKPKPTKAMPEAAEEIPDSTETAHAKDILFEASFDGQTTPEIAPETGFRHSFKRPSANDAERDQPIFTDGLRGKSLRLRDKGEAVTWSMLETPVPPEGTLSFWFRPHWPSYEKGRTQARNLLNTSAFTSIRKWPRHFASFACSAPHIRGRHAAPWGRFWKSETWHHNVVTWSRDHTQKFYLDGELVGQAAGKLPQHPDRFVLSATGQAEIDLDELVLHSRQLTLIEIESRYVSGLHAQQLLREQNPAIRVEVGTPAKAVGQQAQGFGELIRFPELYRQPDDSLLLRSDNRAISLHFYDARDAVTPAGKLRWFRAASAGDPWEEITSAEQVARNVYRDQNGETILVAETAKHKGGGVFEATLRRGKIAPKSIAPSELESATFDVGIEPTATADSWLYLNRSIIHTKDGRILISGFIRPKAEAKSRLMILAMSNRGRSWRKVSEVWRDDVFPDRLVGGIGAPPLFGPTQASLLRTSPDRILCVFRTDAALLACESTDDGASWSKPWMVGQDGVNPTLVQSEDLIALSYGRPDIHIAWSADAGKTWFGFTSLLAADRWRVEANNLVGPLGFNYKPGTGHAALLQDGANRFLVAYDTNWISDPKFELPRSSLWVTPVSVANKLPPRSARFVSVASDEIQRSGRWEGSLADTPYYSCRDRAGKLRFEFKGTAIALIHPTFFDGGEFRVMIDGRETGVVSLRTPQSWWGRHSLLASDLAEGKHVVELLPVIQPDARTPVMPDRWPAYEPYYASLFQAAGRTRVALHGFAVW